MSYADLHLHLLPGVDDGSPDEETSLLHAAALAAAGVHEAAVTPHVGHPSFPLEAGSIPERTHELQRAIDREGIRLRLHAGGEIHPSALIALERPTLELIAHGPPGARWVLAEAPFGGIDEPFLTGCEAIRRRGFGLVIAHPERAAAVLTEGRDLLGLLLARGAVLQVNVCSLEGRHGAGARLAGELLVRTGLAYALGSDGHPPGRAHTLASGIAPAIAAGASPAYAKRLVGANPRFLLRHGVPPSPATAPLTAWRAPTEQVDAARRAAAQLAR